MPTTENRSILLREVMTIFDSRVAALSNVYV